MIFIGCMPRSGSSLLRVILDSHPDVHAGPETGWLSAEQPREELLEDILARPGQRYVNKLPANLSVAALEILKELQEHLGRPFLFIHVYRNPFDTICSYLKTIESPVEARKEFAMDAKAFIAGYRWFREANAFRAIEVSYEDLIRETSRTLGQVCEFLGLSMHPDMLRHSDLEHQTIDHYSDRNAVFPVFTSSVGQYERYRELMDDQTVELCRELGRLLPDRGREHWVGAH